MPIMGLCPCCGSSFTWFDFAKNHDFPIGDSDCVCFDCGTFQRTRDGVSKTVFLTKEEFLEWLNEVGEHIDCVPEDPERWDRAIETSESLA